MNDITFFFFMLWVMCVIVGVIFTILNLMTHSDSMWNLIIPMDIIAVCGTVVFVLFNTGHAAQSTVITDSFEIIDVNGMYVEPTQRVTGSRSSVSSRPEYIVYAKAENGNYVPQQFKNVEIICGKNTMPYAEVSTYTKKMWFLRIDEPTLMVYLPEGGK